jgi:hypothetical protein
MVTRIPWIVESIANKRVSNGTTARTSAPPPPPPPPPRQPLSSTSFKLFQSNGRNYMLSITVYDPRARATAGDLSFAAETIAQRYFERPR